MNANAAALPIQALVSGYAMHLWGDKVLFMLQAYFDDSSSDYGDKNFFLAGYFAKADTWVKFSKDWDRELKRPPSIEWLHMVEAQNLRGPFRGWSKTDRDNKIARLAKVIRKYQLRSIHVSVSGALYADTVGLISPHFLSSPYFHCFYALILRLGALLAESDTKLPIDFIFDEQGQVGIDAVLWYDQIKSEHPELKHILGSTPVFRDDKKVLPLQAADMFAWHLRRASENRPEDKWFVAGPDLVGDQKNYWLQIPKDMLVKHAELIKKIPGIETVQGKKAWKEIRPVIASQLRAGIVPPALALDEPKGFFKRLAGFVRLYLFGGRNKS